MQGSFAQTFTSQTMNLDLTKTIGGPKKLTGLCTDLFLIVIKMREAEDLGTPEALRKLIAYYLDLFEKNCRTISIPQDTIADAKYALVALIDETVLSIPGPCRDYWLSRPLQLDYFGHATAGEEFFRKLDKIGLQLESSKEVAEVYYLCLSLGFEGKYKIAQPQERLKIIENLGMKLKRLRGPMKGMLSPHSYFAEASGSAGKSGKGPIPLWVVGAGCAGVLVALYGILFMVNSSQLGTVFRIVGTTVGN